MAMTAAADSLPTHVAIIMDGNGRWARQRHLPAASGHREGAEAVRRVVEVCADQGVRYLTLYAFSLENWRRPADEVATLMNLLKRFLRERLPDLRKHGLRLNAIGDLEGLPEDVRAELLAAIDSTRNNQKGTLTLALNYGARQEMVAAARQLAAEVAAGRLRPEQIDEACFAAALQTHALPDPDLIIRTSGELRLSNFLLWQASYAEFWFTDTLWPDFGKEEFQAALDDYARRQRRYGARLPSPSTEANPAC